MDKTNLFSYVKEKFFPSYKPNQQEELVSEIIDLLFNSEDTECITAPISGKYYISNKTLNYWVKVSDTSITITNHKFTYVVQSPILFNEQVIRKVKEYIEKDREQFEQQVFQNELDLLYNIRENIETKLTESYS